MSKDMETAKIILKATSGYLNKKPRELQEAQLIALYNRLDDALHYINKAHNSIDPDAIYEYLTRAEDHLNKAREMSIDMER